MPASLHLAIIMTVEAEQFFPKLEKGDLVDLGGWSVLKEARGLVEANVIRECVWEAPILKGMIQIGGVKYFPRFNLRTVTFAENRCNCRKGQQGMVCAHALALCIHKVVAAETVEEVPVSEVEEVAEADLVVRSLVLSEGKGADLRFNLYLPPNLPVVAGRDAIMIKLEAVFEHKQIAPEKLDRGRAYRLEKGFYEAVALVENWCGGRLYGLLQLTRAQLRDLLNHLVVLPVVFWINKPQTALSWDGEALPGVHEFLTVAEESAKEPEQEPEKVKERPFPPSRARDLTPMVVDGSTQYLAITLPSRESEGYRDVLDLLKTNGFVLEPSNRKWWLRDRHKTLCFLAKYLEDLKNNFQANFTDNFNSRTANLRFGKIIAEAKEIDDGFVLEARLEAGSTSEESLRQAVEKGQSYVSDGEETYLLEPSKLERFGQAQRSLSGDSRRTFSTRYGQRLNSTALRDAEELFEPVADSMTTPETWKKRSAALKSVAQLEPAPLDKNLDDQLRGYQRIGAAWMHHLFKSGLGGILADEMGLGKTIQALALLAGLQKANADKKTSLVVCPASLLENWRREAVRFTPLLKVSVHHGSDRLKDALAFDPHDLVITSYGTLVRDLELFQTVEFQGVVVDEAQHIKNRRTRSARSLRSLRAEVRFVLTGTPIENSLDDLRSLIDFIMPGYLAKLPPQASLDERVWYRERHRQQALPYILRRTKAQVAPELPEKIEQVVYCRMETAQRRLYDDFTTRAREEIFNMEMSGAGEGKLRMTALTHLLRLRQICAEPRLVNKEINSDDSAKLGAFLEILDEALDDQHRILLFSQFVTVLNFIRKELVELGHAYCYLDGQTRNRQDVCDQFNNDESIPVFLISLKAGGTGFNLTGADTVVHFDPWWNPAVEFQATDRAHRIGQKKVVTSIKLIAAQSIEEKVLEMQRSKSALLRELLDESAAATSKVSLAEIRSLLN